MSRNLDLFLAPRKLEELRTAEDIQIVTVDTADNFSQGHIPGALLVTKDDFVASQGDIRGLLPDLNAVAQNLAGRGLNQGMHIIAYDDKGGSLAARLLYTLEVMGHEAFSLLDGGLSAWQAAALPLEAGATNPPMGDFSMQAIRQEYVANRHWIEQNLDNDDVQLLDVRSAEEFNGQDVRSACGGHIPGAINMDWRLFKDDNGQLKSLATIRDMLTERGLDLNNEIVTYCQSHMRSAFVYLVLKALGVTKRRGYPGAWSDWGNARDTAIETTES